MAGSNIFVRSFELFHEYSAAILAFENNGLVSSNNFRTKLQNLLRFGKSMHTQIV